MNRLIKTTLSSLLLISALSMPFAAQAQKVGAAADDGKFTFALTGKYPPFNFINEKGELDGFDVEIAKEIGKRIGMESMPITTAWDGILAGLLANKYDTIIGSMAITDERLKAVDFSDPYYRSGAQLFTKSGSNITDINQLEGKKVGVTLGTTFEKWVRENAKGVEVVTYKGVPEMLLELNNNRIAGFITDKLVGLIAINKKGVPIDFSGDLLYPELIGIAVQKSNPELLASINEALSAMKKDGTYETISKKWFKTDIR